MGTDSACRHLRQGRSDMLSFKETRFPIDVILVRTRWYLVYPLSCRHIEGISEERGVAVGYTSPVLALLLHRA